MVKRKAPRFPKKRQKSVKKEIRNFKLKPVMEFDKTRYNVAAIIEIRERIIKKNESVESLLAANFSPSELIIAGVPESLVVGAISRITKFPRR